MNRQTAFDELRDAWRIIGRAAARVVLTGEAAFTVVHDDRRPFTVRTPRLIAHDLGTRFIVKAHADDAAEEGVVAEGKVAVALDVSPTALAEVVVTVTGEQRRMEVGNAIGTIDADAVVPASPVKSLRLRTAERIRSPPASLHRTGRA